MIDHPIRQHMDRSVLRGESDMLLRDVVGEMNRRRQSAFIVCEEGQPIGIITERDTVAVLDRSLAGDPFDETLAADVMASPVHTLSESEMIGAVIQVMNERGFRRVPIVDDKGKLSGIINLTDLQFATNIALERRGRDLEVAVMARTAELQAANAKLEALSLSDGLTGLLNRRALTDRLEELHALSRRYGNPYSVVLLDIDHFKKYNDALGHVKGDEAIRAVAGLLESSIRSPDTAYRYGGEEFLVALPETSIDGAARVANRIRRDMEAQAIPHPDSTTSNVLTVSVGYVSVTRHSHLHFEGWKNVVEAADRALYQAKESGRNRTARSNEGS